MQEMSREIRKLQKEYSLYTVEGRRPSRFYLFILIAVLALLLVSYSLLVYVTNSTRISENESEEWHPVVNISEISGRWISATGSTYEWPLELNGKSYLHYAWAETDDTALWMDYARKHNLSLHDMWLRRYSLCKEIYGEMSPVSDRNGTQFGYKLRQDVSLDENCPFLIYSRQEFLVPIEIVEKNLSFFQMRGKDELMENGTFSFLSERFNVLTADNEIYERYIDFWRDM